MKHFVILGAALALAACGGAEQSGGPEKPSEAASSGEVEAADAADDSAPASYAQCAACHQIKKGGAHGLGPNLFGVYGTKAGELAGFNFSPAMKASGLTWDDAALDKFLASPRTTIPGTKMSFPGQPDAAKRAEIIAFLKKNR